MAAVQKLAIGNGVPLEVCNSLMAQAGASTAAIKLLETHYQYPLSNDAQNVLSKGKGVGDTLDSVKDAIAAIENGTNIDMRNALTALQGDKAELLPSTIKMMGIP